MIVVRPILANKIDPIDDLCRYNREFFHPEIIENVEKP